MTTFDFLVRVLATPASFWSLFVLIFSLVGMGVYIGYSGKIIRLKKNSVDQEAFEAHRVSVVEHLARLVTKDDLRLAFSDLKENVISKLVTTEHCEDMHKLDAERLVEIAQVRTRQEAGFERLRRLEKVANGSLKGTE